MSSASDSGVLVDWSKPFWRLVCPEALSGCWLWMGKVFRSGYGQARFNGSSTNAHRAAWQRVHGPIGDRDLFVCHACDVKLCVNPDHLFLATHDENMADKVRKDRQARGARNPNARIDDSVAREIIQRSVAGERHWDIALEMRVHPSIVGSVIAGRSWKHVRRES